MFSNIGPAERKLRIIIGLILMVTGFAAPVPDLWHMAFLSFGVVLLMPSAMGFCPFKALLLRKLS